MFPRQNRLSRQELSTVLKNGCLLHSGLFTLRVAQNQESILKTAFVMSKKEAKHAVDRNRAKRLTRAAMRSLLGKISPLSIAILIKKPLLSKSVIDIASELESALKLKGFCI